MTTTTQAVTPGAEDQIRQTFDQYVDAMKRKDLDTIMSLYASDVVAFDVPPPLSYAGRDEYRKSWEKGLSMMQGELEYEARNLKIGVSGDLAYLHGLTRMGMTMSDGERMDSWMRLTWCLRKTQGKWLIVHEHGSFPIDPESNQALTNLKP